VAKLHNRSDLGDLWNNLGCWNVSEVRIYSQSGLIWSCAGGIGSRFSFLAFTVTREPLASKEDGQTFVFQQDMSRADNRKTEETDYSIYSNSEENSLNCLIILYERV
jgi:hypothetical protein